MSILIFKSQLWLFLLDLNINRLLWKVGCKEMSILIFKSSLSLFLLDLNINLLLWDHIWSVSNLSDLKTSIPFEYPLILQCFWTADRWFVLLYDMNFDILQYWGFGHFQEGSRSFPEEKESGKEEKEAAMRASLSLY